MQSSARTRLLFVLALLVAAGIGVFIATRGDDDDGSSTTASGDCEQVSAPAPKKEHFKKPQQVLARGQDATAQVETSCGTFTIDLDTEQSPKTTNSFAFLAEQGFYDGTVFHRIAPGFVIQGGDPGGSDPATAGGGGPGYTVTEPPPQNTTYENGLVAMAKTSVEPPGASGSQFFVVTAPADAGLPPDYAVLGRVTDGMDVVDEIGKLGDAQEKPTQVVTIDKITISS
jgi:peptidyl-prolyl cis-trans isomerase B (cyclophilin B)